ncbi:hypothetical protein CPT03_16940 [Pedobacter ginsengisoli]|uniref:Peptidase S74 domain-containing protein n=1 Tax=Pedobacter ginsengisoli TaxID=363852 RepID=A0A2D1U8V6_9SPHI|nr:tail fiber protein [Pedobacter ginsengisoli]ATP58031.1 hypothetical protein CPT03_16940 [Pedobacter ginsengisoli]
MKINFLSKILIICLLSSLCYQSKTSAQTNTFPTTGRVGIGVTNPIYPLTVMVPSNSNALSVTNGTTGLIIQTISTTTQNAGIVGAYNGLYNDLDIRSTNVVGGQLYLKTTGNVGIGTTSPTEKLSVKGKIRAQEIKVEAADWPDYVFAKDYELVSLEQTEKHIEEKGHLPGIPSAKEVKANGVDLGEMNAKLLQKIEELTLYLIEIKKENDEQKKDILYLKSKIK